MAETPFVFTWRRERALNNQPKSNILTLNTPYSSCLSYSSFSGVGKYTNLENKKQLCVACYSGGLSKVTAEVLFCKNSLLNK